MHGQLNIEFFDIRRERHISHKIYKIMNMKAPPALIEMFSHVYEVHERQTHSSSQN